MVKFGGGVKVLSSIMEEKHFQTVQAPQLLTMQTIKGIAIRHTD